MFEKLEQLSQGKGGQINDSQGHHIYHARLYHKGKLFTFVVENPCVDVGKIIERWQKNGSNLIPSGANAYLLTEFNEDTNHLRDEKQYSVYAIQFYYVCRECNE